ncbi:MAG: hypothetical protein E6J90_08475 [Deltaproteobacteria bacterium]|nr:MAG: hypothetical protein E6J90_08475 [Deltaproteobacteria bacterium]
MTAAPMVSGSAGMRGQRFCAWFHRYRLVLLAGWIVHAVVLHAVFIGFPSWDAFSYRLPPIVELIQHGELGLERYHQWALHGYVPFAELVQLPFLYVFGLPGLLIGYPLIVFPLCVVAVYKLAKQLSGSVHTGNFAALAYAAIPMVNQQPFTGYIDFIVSAATAYFLYALLALRASPRPARAAIRLAAATVLVTMTRATGLYIAIVLSALVLAALYLERRPRVRLVERRRLAVTLGAFAAGALPVIAVQTYKYLAHGSPLYPYQFHVLGVTIGSGVSTKDLFFYAGLADETWRNFARNAFGAWIWPSEHRLCFFDSRHLGGGWVLPAAIVALPAFLRAATRLETYLVIACVLVSLIARDFWLPRWAYTLVVALTLILGRALPALAGSPRRRDRWLFGALTALLFVHLARPEFDLWQLRRRSGFAPRLNVTESSHFRRGHDAMDPYPDRHARFIILDVNANGFLIPIYGRHLTNEVVTTIPLDAIGDRCSNLRALVAADPDLLFIDDQDRAVDCSRACAIALPDGSCGAYRLFDPHAPPGTPWAPVVAGGAGAGWLTSGWSFPEAWGTWAVGSDAELAIPAPALHVPLTLDVDWFGAASGLTAQLTAGGKTYPVVFEHAGQGVRQSFAVPPVDASPVVVHLHVDRPVVAADGRRLAIGVGRVRLRAATD